MRTATTRTSWRTSSYTGGGQGQNCVEVAVGADVVAVRDTKNRAGGMVRVSPGVWRRFVAEAAGR